MLTHEILQANYKLDNRQNGSWKCPTCDMTLARVAERGSKPMLQIAPHFIWSYAQKAWIRKPEHGHPTFHTQAGKDERKHLEQSILSAQADGDGILLKWLMDRMAQKMEEREVEVGGGSFTAAEVSRFQFVFICRCGRKSKVPSLRGFRSCRVNEVSHTI